MSDHETKAVIDPKDIAGYGIPSHFANNFKISMNPMFTKLALGEFMVGNPDKDAQMHHCFTMPTQDIVRLAEVILSVAAQMQGGSRVHQVNPNEVAKFSRKVN